MKNLIFSYLFLVAFQIVVAQERIATFFAQDGDKFWVIMDGVKQNEKPSANVKVTGLVNDYYRVKVIFENEQIKSIDQNIGTVGFIDDSQEQKPADVVYNIKRKKNGEMVMRVNSFKPASSSKNKEPQQEVISFHTQQSSGQQSSNQTSVTTTTSNNNANNDPVNINLGVSPSGINMNVTGVNTTTGTSTTSVTTTTSTTTVNNNQTPKKNNGSMTATTVISESRTSRPCSQHMQEQSLNQLKASINKQSFASNKMQVAKQGIKSCLTANQIKDLIGLFSFEQDKLEFAKFAHEYCSNKEDYFIVNDVFSFSSTVEDLNEYLQEKQR